MKFKKARVRYGNIIARMYVPETQKQVKAVIFAQGMPGVPPEKGEGLIKLARKGYLVVLPHYIGTFDSYGKFTFNNSVDTVLQTINFLKKGKVKLPWSKESLTWKIRDISLIGGSFGASVVLVAGAKSKDIKNIVAIATPTNYRDQGRKYESEETLEFDWEYVKYCCENTWRIEDKYWRKIIKGDSDINPVDYVKQLKNKNVLLIHGMLDKDVNYQRSVDLYNAIKSGKGKSKLILLKRTPHIGNTLLKRKNMLDEVVRWIK